MSRLVIAALEDLFFASKIRGAGEQAGAEIVFVKNGDRLFEEVEKRGPDLVVLDLQAASLDPVAAVEKLKAAETTRAVRVVGFYSHVETELQQRAKAAGFDQVLPRSVFSQRLGGIIRGEF